LGGRWWGGASRPVHGGYGAVVGRCRSRGGGPVCCGGAGRTVWCRRRRPPFHRASVRRVGFFFQAEDGIRDWSVTGVQTCALPISGRTDPAAFLGLDLPIAGIAGDQQAALFGQACFAPGDAKCTYGTGSFVLANTGSSIARPAAGLLSTVAWMGGSGALTYAAGGAVFVAGAAGQGRGDGLGRVADAAQSEYLAASVPDSGGVVFVPALTGLGAPHWDPDARGAVFGITRGTTRAHLARATLEAIAFEVRDVYDAMAALPGGHAPMLRVDGGAAANGLLMQMQADQLQVPVERPEVGETTALGAPFLAGLGTGVWSPLAAIAATWRLDRRFEPGARDEAGQARWGRAVERSRGWAR